VLYLTITFVDVSPSFSGRFLLPIVPPLIVLVTVAAWRLVVERLGSRKLHVVAIVGVLLVGLPVFASHTSALGANIRSVHDRSYHAPPMMSAISKLPAHTVVFTNSPDGVYLWTKHYAVALPPTHSVWTGARNAKYADDLFLIGPALCRHPGVVALFAGRFTGFTANQIAQVANLQPRRYPDGWLLRPGPNSCPH